MFQHLLPAAAAGALTAAAARLDGFTSYADDMEDTYGAMVPRPIPVAATAETSEGRQLSTDSFSLTDCLMGLPAKISEPALPPVRADDVRQPCHFAFLPPDVVRRVVEHLDAPSMTALALSCKGMESMIADVAPGLLLTLFPHQVDMGKLFNCT